MQAGIRVLKILALYRSAQVKKSREVIRPGKNIPGPFNNSKVEPARGLEPLTC